MGKALSYAVREKIIFRREKGQSFKEISVNLGCSESGAKKIWYAYKKQGIPALSNNYSRCGGRSKFTQAVHDAVNEIRDNNQGATYVYSKLVKDYSHLSIPKARTLSRWWKKQGTNRQRGRPVSSEKKDGQNKPITLGKSTVKNK